MCQVWLQLVVRSWKSKNYKLLQTDRLTTNYIVKLTTALSKTELKQRFIAYQNSDFSNSMI